MTTSTLSELLSGTGPVAETNRCLYIVRQGRKVLYVGKTERSTLAKRFAAHMGQGPYPAKLKFNVALQAAMPAATAWTVQTLSHAEWNELFIARGLPRRHKLNTAESALIRLLKPELNVTSHPNR